MGSKVLAPFAFQAKLASRVLADRVFGRILHGPLFTSSAFKFAVGGSGVVVV